MLWFHLKWVIDNPNPSPSYIMIHPAQLTRVPDNVSVTATTPPPRDVHILSMGDKKGRIEGETDRMGASTHNNVTVKGQGDPGIWVTHVEGCPPRGLATRLGGRY